jgi:Flp pilus assembly protein TadG
MAEFAMVLPILALLLFGVIQFGIVFNQYLTLTDAVRAGARKAAVSRQSGNPCGQAVSAVKGASGDLNGSRLTISCASSWQPGADVTVTASYPYSINLLGKVVMSGSLSSSTTERVE